MDWSVDAIKAEHVKRLVQREVFLIERTDYGWQVQWWTPGSVAPQSDYDTPHEAAARLLQLMQIKEPVIPQGWPEDVCIGNIETS